MGDFHPEISQTLS